VSAHHAILGLRRAYIDDEHAADLATPVYAPRTRHKGAVPSEKTSNELELQFAPRLEVDRGVHCFLGNGPCGVVWEYALEGPLICCGDQRQSIRAKTRKPGKAVDIEIGFWFCNTPTGRAGLLRKK